MIITPLKTYVTKKHRVTLNYRSNKHFHLKILFQNVNEEIRDYDKVKEIFMEVLNQYVSVKKRLVRGNNAPFMNKILFHAFMQRCKLKSNFNKYPIDENKKLYNKQWNLCVTLKKEKGNYYNNLDLNIFDDNNKFWQWIKSLSSDKEI